MYCYSAITLGRMLSVCFPNMNLSVRKADGSYSGSIRCVVGANWVFGSAFGSLKCLHVHLCAISLPSEQDSRCSESERIKFGKHSVCSRSILAVRLGIRQLKNYFVHVQNNFHRPSERSEYVYSESVRKAFYEHPACTENVREACVYFQVHSE